MSTTTLDLVTNRYNERTAKPSVFTNFINRCDKQEENRLLWSAVGLTTHGCILTPITVLTILLAGASLEIAFVTFAILAMVMVLVTNLAALPTKITLPTLILSILIDLVLIVAVMI